MEEITDSELEALENLREPESPGKDFKKPICEHRAHTLMLFDYETLEDYEYFMHSCYYCYECKKIIEMVSVGRSCTDPDETRKFTIYDGMYDYITKSIFRKGDTIRSLRTEEESKEIIDEMEKIVIGEMGISQLQVLSVRKFLSNADENMFEKDVSRENYDVIYVFGSLYANHTVFSEILCYGSRMKYNYKIVL